VFSVYRQAVEPRTQLAKVLFLLRREVLPSLHPPQHLLLALRRHVVEVLQPLFQLLLALRRKPPEIGITLERAPLLIERLIAMLIQPLPGVMSLRRRLIRTIVTRSGTEFRS
jgi:hypothetical protein